MKLSCHLAHTCIFKSQSVKVERETHITCYVLPNWDAFPAIQHFLHYSNPSAVIKCSFYRRPVVNFEEFKKLFYVSIQPGTFPAIQTL
jgi:hypothetical protein